ncbi:MAG: cytochrome o ubiquinol oxidase subunit IV [Duganella sp.]
MSAPINHGGHAGHDHHGHDDHGHHEQDDGNHGTMKDYAIGFVLSVILTAIPFWLVMAKVFDKSSTTAMVVLGFAAVQIVVHMVYFLHMNGKIEGGWTLLSTLFTLVLLVIVLAGSIWVMYHMNVNMMPSMGDDVHNMHDMK